MKKGLLFAFLCLVVLTLFFFHLLLNGFVPFPGDLLVGEYAPYNSYSFQGFAPGGYPNKAQDFDVLKLLYPDKEFAITMLKKGEFPLWNPYNFSGNPHLASLQSGVFYPFTILFLLLPSFITAWSIYIFMQPVFTGFFTFLFLRELKLGAKAAFFGAAAFAFSSYMTVWIEYGNLGHALLWLPLAMWLTLKIFQKPKILTSIALILVLSFSILAGHIQLTMYLFLYLFLFIIFYAFFVQGDGKKAIYFIPIFLSPLFLCAVQLLPSIELFQQSTRTSYTKEAFIALLIPIQHVVTAFVPDFFGNPATRNYWLTGTYIERVSYIGVIPLFIAVYGFFARRTIFTWFFAGSLSFIFLLTFDTPISRILFSHFLPPLLSTGVPSRSMYLFCFAASVLAAFGLDAFLKEKNKRAFIKTTLFMGGVYILLWIFVLASPFLFAHESWIVNLDIAKRNLILPSVVFIAGITFLYSFHLASMKRYVFFAILFITFLDLFYFFQKITPFVPALAVYPETEVLTKLKNIQGIDRSWGYGSAYIEANIQTTEKIFGTDGYDALHGKRYGEFVSASKDGKLESVPARSEANIIGGFGGSDLRDNTYRQKMLDLLGVKYVLHKTNLQNSDYQTFPSEIYSLIWQGGQWQIYENKESLSRAFLVGDYAVETDKQKIISTLLSKEFDIQNKVILEEKLPSSLVLGEDNNATASVKNYQPNKVVIETKSAKDSLLFLSDNYFPGWHVSIDGKNDKIYRADYAFRAVPLEKGEHEVIFWYYPFSFDIGFKVSIVSTVSLVFIMLIGVYFKKRNV